MRFSKATKEEVSPFAKFSNKTAGKPNKKSSNTSQFMKKYGK